MPDIDVTKLDPTLKDALLSLLSSIETQDEYLRLSQLREYKRLNLFWHGFQYLFWSDVDNDWRIPTHEQISNISSREETRWVFNYVVNHFKAHGESIIAALSADIPDVRFGPRNADDPDDRRAVEAADHCVQLVEKWNRAKLLIIDALFYLCTEGFVAAYTYHKKDPDFGLATIPQFSTQSQPGQSTNTCEQCGYTEPVDDESVEPLQPAGQPETEGPENVQDMNNPNTPPMSPKPIGPEAQCPQCGAPMQQTPGEPEEVPYQSGEKLIPKGREVIEIYGGSQVRLPPYVFKQADAGYLVHYVDSDPAVFKSAFPEVAEDIGEDSGQSYERLMRQSSLTMDGYQLNFKLTTQKKVWLRPWMLNRLGAGLENEQKQLASMFPTGIYFSVIGAVLCEARDESMDDHWAVTKAGPSRAIHADPVLKSLVPLQELKNNLTNLLAMQVEYGVPATYADPEVFDFDGQSKQEVAPGYVYPATPKPGTRLEDAFYTEKSTILPKEATELVNSVTQDEQFVVGSFPSIYGGPSVSGSKTLGEYDKSRAFALQRLSLVWYFINVWWGEITHKAVQSFIDHQIEDEPLTTQTRAGFETKWIRQADFKGSFERLDPDASADFPVSFSQKRATLMQILQLANEEINSVLLSPENAGVVQDYLGLPEIKLPTEVQSNKQIREISDLVSAQPLDPAHSSVPVDLEVDAHPIHIQVLIDFLAGDTGQDLKKDDPAAYANCLAHLMEHKMAMMASMPQPAAPGQAPGAPPPPHPAGPPQGQPQGAPQNV